MRSGEEIQLALRKFVTKWGGYRGGERSEAQTFLNELFAYYGSDRLEVGAHFEDFTASAGFMDLHWPGECIVEMKAPTKEVSSAREQVKRYWEESADEKKNTPAARWVVLCNFASFEVWEPGRFLKSPRATFDLTMLPQRYEALMFLAGPALAPSFLEHHKELTAEAAKLVAQVYQSLVDRSAAPPDEIGRVHPADRVDPVRRGPGPPGRVSAAEHRGAAAPRPHSQPGRRVGVPVPGAEPEGQPQPKGPPCRHPLRQRGPVSRPRRG